MDDIIWQIDKKLLYWSDFLIHKNKARLTRLTQYLIKTKRLSLKKQPKIIGIKPKQVRRETTREKKALKIAKLEKSIEKELLERLKNGIYGEEPLNVDRNIWKKVLGLPKNQEKDENESEYENSEKYVRFLSKKNNLEEWLKKYKHTRNEDFIEDFIALNSDESEENDINNKENEQEIEDIFQKKRKHYYKQSKTPKRSKVNLIAQKTTKPMLGKAYIELEYEQENQLTDKKM
ncbi:hypothetical protein PCANB_000860 [Pneumocystis canis]|nr:hypothetical protein PCK1_000790 [Pneumocystis canis]KAG5437429.1 hypothetical protein PCANB_000860 [Pneumocystis canis]